MHILLIHQVFIQPQDAGGTRHFEFASYFAEQGHRVTVIAGNRSYLTGEQALENRKVVLEAGVELIRCRVLGQVHRNFIERSLGFISFMWASFWAGLRLREVDVIWATSPPLFQACSAWALAWIRRIPWLFEVRDLWPAFAVQMGVLRNRGLILLAEWVERFLYRRADRLVVNSPGFIEHVLKAGAASARVVMVPNGVDSALFESRDHDPVLLSPQHGLRGKFIALYAGAHGPANDLELILRAADLLREDPRIAFVLLGDGKEKPALMDLAQQLQLPNLVFLPPLPKSDIPALMGEIDCGLAVLKPIPLFETTFPNKVFDYMAAGKPVVLAIGGVIREVVEGAEAGLAVPPGDAQSLADAVRQLADNPSEVKRLGENGRALVKTQFEREELARTMLSALSELGAKNA